MKNNRKAVLAAVILFFLALGITAYPVVSNFLYDRHRSLVETAYFEAMEQLDDETIRKAKQEAEEYNALLSKGISESRSDSEMSIYNDILNVNGDGVMAYIEIPAIDINLPISHGTEAKTLENYVGHVVGSSLPVGGESTHAVISGHSGMAGQKMFTDLHELKAGDMVYIHVLDEVLAYTVDEVNTVLPGDTSLLGIEQGKDCLTLITCTPVGVNAHRLLVHCSRVPYGQEEQADEEAVPETSTWQRQYFTGIGCGVAALLLVLICHGLISVWRRKHGKGP